MKDKLILEIIIEVYSEQITSLTGAAGTVQMIPFGGTVDCELFKGGGCSGWCRYAGGQSEWSQKHVCQIHVNRHR